MHRLALCLVIICTTATTTKAQLAQATTGILFRTVMIKTATEQGTMFSIDVDGREYWLTAKHLLTGAKHPPFGPVKEKMVSLYVLDPMHPGTEWDSYKFTVIDPGEEIDIVALAPEKRIQQFPVPSLAVSAEQATIGGECEFLGFPFANSWRAELPGGQSYLMPYVKHCYISGRIDHPAKMWILDGINNDGFSGGPVIFRTGADQRIMAVVSGYIGEYSDVIAVPIAPAASQKNNSGTTTKPNVSAQKKKNVVSVNAGIISAFDAQYAIDAIKANPIGPQ